MFTKEQLLCIISALKIRKYNVELQAIHYANGLSDCGESNKREWWSKMLDDCKREIDTIEDTLKSAESAIQTEADKPNEEESEDE